MEPVPMLGSDAESSVTLDDFSDPRWIPLACFVKSESRLLSVHSRRTDRCALRLADAVCGG